MSDSFHWKIEVPHVRREITLPTGVKITLSLERLSSTDPRLHIASYAANTLYWAQDRPAVEEVCRAHPDEILIKGDSYDMTGAEFLEYIRTTKRHDYSLLNKEFV